MKQPKLLYCLASLGAVIQVAAFLYYVDWDLSVPVNDPFLVLWLIAPFVGLMIATFFFSQLSGQSAVQYVLTVGATLLLASIPIILSQAFIKEPKNFVEEALSEPNIIFVFVSIYQLMGLAGLLITCIVVHSVIKVRENKSGEGTP